jgi:1-acyl-sn-glycerol-3-phosphate acyltransferase
MFPEATRTRDGSIGLLQAGSMTVAARAGVPVMPVVIDGAFEAWPRTRLWPRPRPIRVACGRPISAAEVAAGDPETLMAAVRREMLELQAELRRK